MVSQLLGGLFGTQDQDDEPVRRRRARDFVDRYERGDYGQLNDEEVLQNYRAATAHLSPDEYRQAAKETFRQMSPEQRRELKRYLKHRSGGRFDAPGEDPDELARAAEQFQQQDKDGGLASLFGFGESGNAAGRSAGDTAKGMLDNPVVKVALAGVAAMAAKRLLDKPA
jgi:hypothetical protein